MVAFARGAIRGEIGVPGDKSISHRALILSALAPEPLHITNLNPGRDVHATQRGLAVLRQAQHDSAERRDTCEIDCMNSGSTARMLLGVCAGADLRARFDGDASLRRRPMEPVAAQLRAFGARIETTEGKLPLEIRGRDDVQTRHFILLSPSAQVKSALLFAALYAGVSIDITGDAGSRDHTERLLHYEGADIQWDGGSIALSAAPTRRDPIDVAGDFSAAAFFITAATVSPNSDVLIRDVGVNPTRTGLLDALRRMGANIELRNERERCGELIADVAVRHAMLRGVAVDESLALRAIDEIPLLAVAAAFAAGETTIAGIGDLRTKESDRIAAVEQLLAAVGFETRALARGLTIRGGSPAATGAIVASHGDHRIAMAAAVLATAAGPLEIDDAESVDVSFPGFLARLERARERRPART
ncbi:MAG TPA: 3-phosphoshikimate 1-carboxyvinyltransferase [Candidatus Tyrphobacter sp.]